MLYPTLKIDHPVFIGIGSADINVPTAMQKRFADAVKSAGTRADVHIYEGWIIAVRLTRLYATRCRF
jgi:dipeptidyl aminopeptidase/acylaminoacyl peptidase